MPASLRLFLFAPALRIQQKSMPLIAEHHKAAREWLRTEQDNGMRLMTIFELAAKDESELNAIFQKASKL